MVILYLIFNVINVFCICFFFGCKLTCYTKEWKINIFKIIDTRFAFRSCSTNPVPPKPKASFRHLKQGIQDCHRKCVSVPAYKSANNNVVV